MKKLHKILTAFVFCLIFTLLLTSFASAAEDVGRVTGVKASAVTNNSVTITWSPLPKADGYRIQFREGNGEWQTLTDTLQTTSYTVKNLKIGLTYSFRVNGYDEYKTLFGTSYKHATASVTVSVSNTLSKVTGLKVVTTTPTKVKLSWSKVDGAQGYLVQKLVGKTWKNVKTTTSTTYTVTGLKTDVTTSFRVRAYVTQSGKKVYGSVSSTVKGKTAVPKIEDFKVTATGTNSAKLTWDKASVSGYQIYKKTSSGSWKKYKTIYSKTTVSFTEKSLTLGTKYYYKVRGFYKTDSKTYYGSFTSAKSVTPTLPAVIGIQLSSITKNKAVITWDKVEGAQGYQVYDYSSGSAVKLPTVSTNRAVIDIEDGNVYEIKVRAYKKVSGKTVKGTFSEAYPIYSTPGQVKNLQGEVLDDGSLKFTWDKVKNAHGYTLYVLNNSTKQFERLSQTDTNTITVNDVSGLPGLNFRVTAFVKNSGVYLYGMISETIFMKVIQTPVLTAGNCTATDITLKWTEVSEATTYILEKFDFVKNAWTEVVPGGIASDKYTDNGTSARGYLYRVYAKNDKGIRSAVSKEVFVSTTGISVTQDGAAQTITWPEVPGAAKYRVLAKYTDSDRGLNRILTNVTKTTATVALTPGTIQSLSVFAYTENGDIITDPVVSELVFRVDNFKILSANNPHYDHSVNSQLLYLVEAINKTKHETDTVAVRATSVVNYNTDKFFVNNTTFSGKDLEGLIEFINLLSGVDRGSDELEGISLSGKETSDETLTFTDAIAKNKDGKYISLARYIDPSDEEYAYLYGSEDPSAWKDGVKSVTVTPITGGGYQYTVELYEETFGNETNVADAFYHPGLVTTIASLGYFSEDGLENQLTTVGDTTITAVINADGTLDSYKVSSPYSMRMKSPVEGISGIKSFGMEISGKVSSSYTFTR